MISTTSQYITTSASSNMPPQAYFSTLDAAFVYIREYIEDNIGENISVCVKETTLYINGKEKELYEVSFGAGAAQQYVTVPYNAPQVPYTPYTPQAPQKDEWWKSPYVYCGPTPQVTLNGTAQQTKAGCIMQSYGAAAQT